MYVCMYIGDNCLMNSFYSNAPCKTIQLAMPNRANIFYLYSLWKASFVHPKVGCLILWCDARI